ncbi:MAG: glycosyltransferase family 2 protein [Acidobacteriaceae bacterium]
MLLSLVIPVLNEEQTLPITLGRLREVLQDVHWEVIFVDDGSTDSTPQLIEQIAAEDAGVKLIRLSRNFGHQTAITAGLDFADGDAVVVMDADLQDPPELLPRMLELCRQGYDLVSPQRILRESDTPFKRWSAAVYYQIMARMADQKLTPQVGDFRLYSRRGVQVMRSLREQHRYMRGLAAWSGLREIVIPYERQPRAAGKTHYSLWKMIRFAWTGISSFSAFPLRLSIAAGCVLGLIGFTYLIVVVVLALAGSDLVRGWASLIALQCIFSGIILLALGAIGDYVARVYEESKGRPLYVVAGTRNLPVETMSVPRAVILTEPFVVSGPLSSSGVTGPDHSADVTTREQVDERLGIS